jgi:DNA replication protein DnaC
MNAQAQMFLAGLGVAQSDIAIALGTPRATQAVGHVADFIARPAERLLLLSGGVGCGKTLAAAHWLAQLPRYGKASDTPAGWNWLSGRAKCLRASTLTRLNLRYRDEDRDLFDGWKSARWLVIDDLGTESADSLSHVEELVDARASCGWTVVTTNLPVKAAEQSPFGQRYGARISSRVFGNARVGVCGAVDLRRAS